jgi:hypothetical protein
MVFLSCRLVLDFVRDHAAANSSGGGNLPAFIVVLPGVV